MRYIFGIWAAPLVLFWGWYFLSLNDINFGFLMMSRAFNLALFDLYGEMIGVDPATIPWMLGKAFFLDTMIILAIWAFRRRRLIAERVKLMRERYLTAESAPNA